MPDKVLSAKEKKAVIDRAAKRIKNYYVLNNHNIKNAIDDLKFLNLEQWKEDEVKRRDLVGRPALVVDQLNKYVDQVIGDMRLNRARIKVSAADEDSTSQIAKIRQGMIWKIERASNAEMVYDYGGQCVTECGFGAWWVLNRYTEANPFIQELYIQRIRNPLTVGIDPTAKDPMNKDAKYGWVLENIPTTDYKHEWPKAKMPTGAFDGTGMGYELSWDEEGVIVAHYFEIENEDVEYVLVEVAGEDTPRQMKREAFDDMLSKYKAARKQDKGLELPVEIESRTIEVGKVKHYVLSAFDVLEGPTGVPGRYVPIVKISGRERNIEGKTYVRSMIRNGKDPQRLFNFWCTDAAEIVDLIPKAPWQMTAEQMKGYENSYVRANVDNPAALLYNHVEGVPPPSRNMLNQVPTAVFEQISMAKQGISDAVGMYKADVGDTGPERTGAAITARQMPGDVGTFVFIDNQRHGIAHTGCIINSMLDDIYDTERDVEIVNEDDTEGVLKINTTVSRAAAAMSAKPDRYSGMDKAALKKLMRDPHQEYNVIGKGRYTVDIDTGPSFTTQRQEAAARLERMIAAYPKLMDVAGDVVMSLQDFIGAQKIADRLNKLVPEYLDPPKEGQPSKPQPPTDPETLVKLERLKVQQKSLEVKQANLEVAKMKFLNELQGANSVIKKVVLEIMKKIFEQGGVPFPGIENAMSGQSQPAMPGGQV